MIAHALLSGALAGLLSAPHCASMCGPLQAAACSRARLHSGGAALRYQAGRLLSYAFAGALVGGMGQLMDAGLPVTLSPYAFGLLSATALLLLARELWRIGYAARPVVLRTRRSRFTARLLALLPRDAGVFGLGSVLLPCGALASALLLAAATGQRGAGAALMAGFALSSGVGVALGGLVLARLRSVREGLVARGLSVVLAALALVLAARPLVADLSAQSAPGASVSAHAPRCH